MNDKTDKGRFDCRGLACVRGGRRVFDRLNMTLKAGGALVLRGPNGSGKSSLLRLMAGLLHPAEGQIAWDSAPVADDPEAHRARLCYVGHLDAQKPALTLRENLAFWAEIQGGGDVGRALDAFALTALADQPARFLSAGQRRRANLARLALAPRALWLLDEPATALDQETRLRLNALIADLRRTGGMVVVSTHEDLDLREAHTLNMADYAPRPGEAAA
ncbi:MAG: heme ABC exporter ATP-binding protein CcmA [Rhodospirillaceae bacterium]